jgi:hypothetical protein
VHLARPDQVNISRDELVHLVFHPPLRLAAFVEENFEASRVVVHGKAWAGLHDPRPSHGTKFLQKAGMAIKDLAKGSTRGRHGE